MQIHELPFTLIYRQRLLIINIEVLRLLSSNCHDFTLFSIGQTNGNGSNGAVLRFFPCAVFESKADNVLKGVLAPQ